MFKDIVDELMYALNNDREPWDETLYRRAANEIELLRAAGDALAAAVNDEHLPRFCEIGCQSREAVEVWEKIRRG